MSREVTSTPTIPDLPAASPTGAVWGRRAGVAGLALVVIADLVGVLGVHTDTRSASGDGYRLSLLYPAIARPGLDVRWEARVEHPGGFDHPITLALTGDYYSIFEDQGYHPEPASETRTGRELLLTFTPPHGDTFVVDYDAYVQPASEVGRDGRLTLRVGGRPTASVDFRTFLWP